MALACCSGKHFAPVAESHGSGWLLRPYHLEPLTYFGGTAREEAGKKMGGLRGWASKVVSGSTHATEMPFQKVQMWIQSMSLTDGRTFMHTENVWRNKENRTAVILFPGMGTKTDRQGDKDFLL